MKKKKLEVKVSSSPHYALKSEKGKTVLTQSHGCAGSGGPCSGSSCAGGCKG